jgi:hypothetical protein
MLLIIKLHVEYNNELYMKISRKAAKSRVLDPHTRSLLKLGIGR